MEERLRVFIRNYAEVKFTDPAKLRSFLDPLPKRVEMLSLHGGNDFIKTLNKADCCFYHLLLYDIVKASLGVKRNLDEHWLHGRTFYLQFIPLHPTQPINRPQYVPAITNEASSSAEVVRNQGNSSVPNPFQFETRRFQSTLIQSAMSNQDINTTPLQNDSAPEVSRDISVFGNELEIPQQSTPLQAGSFPLAAPPTDRSPIAPVPITRRNVRSPQLPVLRENQAESYVSAAMPVQSKERQQVMDFVRRSQENLTNRRESEQFLQSLDIPQLPLHHGFLLEMEEMIADHRNAREERRRRKRIKLTEVPTVQTRSPSLAIHTAAKVTCFDKYRLPTFHAQRKQLIETFCELGAASNNLQENVYYRISRSVDEMRREESREDSSALARPVQQSQTSNIGRMIPLEIIQEVNSEGQPEIALSPQQQPIMVPEFIEHLIDTEPIRSPHLLRPRDETPRYLPGILRNTGPARRRRRRRRNAVVQIPTERSPEQQPPPTPTDFIQQEPITFNEQSSLGIRTPTRSRVSRPRRITAENDFRGKFQVWLNALPQKATPGTSRHTNSLAELRKIESLYEETSSVMQTISAEKFTPLQTITPSSVGRITAVKRINVLLELNTRGLITLKTDASRNATGVENGIIGNIPVPN